MKFVVDEMPNDTTECPFFVGTASDPICQCGPETWQQHSCDYFKNGYRNDDCPHLKPLCSNDN